MNSEEQIVRLISIIKESIEKTVSKDDHHGMCEYLMELSSLGANAAQLKGLAKELRDSKRMEALLETDYENISTSLVKEILDGKCAKYEGYYVEADRLNSNLTTRCESIRSILSFEKEDMKNSRYQK